MNEDQQIGMRIPSDVRFADLRLSRDPHTGAIGHRWEPIDTICRANGIDPRVFRDGSPDLVGDLLLGWYGVHRAQDGAPDPVMESIVNEVASIVKNGTQ